MVRSISRIWPAPATLAAVTYSRVFSAITAALQEWPSRLPGTSAMASIALNRPGPRIVTSTSASSSDGKARIRSIARMISASASAIAGNEARRDAADQRQRHDHRADDQRIAGAVEEPREDIATDRVGSEQIFCLAALFPPAA